MPFCPKPVLVVTLLWLLTLLCYTLLYRGRLIIKLGCTEDKYMDNVTGKWVDNLKAEKAHLCLLVLLVVSSLYLWKQRSWRESEQKTCQLSTKPVTLYNRPVDLQIAIHRRCARNRRLNEKKQEVAMHDFSQPISNQTRSAHAHCSNRRRKH